MGANLKNTLHHYETFHNKFQYYPDAHNMHFQYSTVLKRVNVKEQVPPTHTCHLNTFGYNNPVQATLAQSAEQTLRKRQVLGSIPEGGSRRPHIVGAFC